MGDRVPGWFFSSSRRLVSIIFQRKGLRLKMSQMDRDEPPAEEPPTRDGVPPLREPAPVTSPRIAGNHQWSCLEEVRRERTLADRSRTKNRLIGASVALVLYASSFPLFLIILAVLGMASDSCGPNSNGGICSAATQSLVNGLVVGGIAAGLLFFGIALFGAKIASEVVWRTTMILALATPAVCTLIAASISGH